MNTEIDQDKKAGQDVVCHRFTVLLSATRRGARLARLLTVAHLGVWGLPVDRACQVVAELAANAVLHGRVPGRDFRLDLTVTGEVLRIAVTDTRGDRLPLAAQVRSSACAADGPRSWPEVETGRGLLLVSVLADRWGVTAGPVPRKTVWAELDIGG
ncbi:ATP-binding protein [Streptomyces sp. 549]|uniref:ATP-binding protein n=1 Tax=Streptomyces sp. 549 TaxID=3049076 RepID=UPI0024C401CB|nr:ATP-binding protein [Streptomyces sp. 549]MDK1475300.1 ATP-binding protein [Streptomyces sp. 549]